MPVLFPLFLQCIPWSLYIGYLPGSLHILWLFLSDNIDFFNNKVSSLGDRYNNIDLKCLYPSFCSFVDAPTGFVYPCDCSIHRDRKIYKIGDLKVQTFKEIWNGEKRKNLRKKLINSELDCKTKCDEANCQFNRCLLKEKEKEL